MFIFSILLCTARVFATVTTVLQRITLYVWMGNYPKIGKYSWQFLSSLMFTSNNTIHSLVSDHIMLKNLNLPSFFLLLIQEAMLTIGPVLYTLLKKMAMTLHLMSSLRYLSFCLELLLSLCSL